MKQPFLFSALKRGEHMYEIWCDAESEARKKSDAYRADGWQTQILELKDSGETVVLVQWGTKP